jgi:FkbM family methyltransferase
MKRQLSPMLLKFEPARNCMNKKPLRTVIEKPLSVITNRLLTTLRNRTDLRMTREEFRYSRISFSQFSEDLAVLRWLHDELPNATPTYVDAGCFHPIHFSNTLLLYKRGWRGVNIDLMPEKIALFNQLRPGDENVVAALGDAPRELAVVTEGALTDRLDTDTSDHPHPDNLALRRTKVVTRTLNDVLSETRLRDKRIGYLNIDCEGHDLSVLRGLNLAVYAPSIITIEAFEPQLDETRDYLTGIGYLLKERLHYTLLFVRSADLCSN